MKYVIVYLSDSGSLYSRTFTSRAEVDEWLEHHDYKAIIIDSSLVVEDRT